MLSLCGNPAWGWGQRRVNQEEDKYLPLVESANLISVLTYAIWLLDCPPDINRKGYTRVPFGVVLIYLMLTLAPCHLILNVNCLYSIVAVSMAFYC